MSWFPGGLGRRAAIELRGQVFRAEFSRGAYRQKREEQNERDAPLTSHPPERVERFRFGGLVRSQRLSTF